MLKYYFEKGQRALLDFMVKSGLSKGNTSYQKFIIFSEYRSGSNLIMNLLKSHPNVVCYSEVFFVKKMFWGNRIYGHSETDPAIITERKDNEHFLKKYIFRKYSKSVHAVCFKLMTGDVLDYKTFDLDLCFNKFQDTKFIFLTRKNLLHRKVSHHLGGLTKTRVVRDENKWKEKLNKLQKFSLGYEDCLNEFETVTARHNLLRTKLRESSVEVMELTYEQLIKEKELLLPKILKWLGLSDFHLSTNQKKQNRKTMRDWLENYNELKEKFKGSPWEHYFDE